jgi:hypothetical protein
MSGIFAAKRDLQERLDSVHHVRSVGVSKTKEGTPFIVVLIENDTPKSDIEKIPNSIDEFDVKVQQFHSIELH